MAVFRRRSTPESASPAAEVDPVANGRAEASTETLRADRTAAKGRPTPKRIEAEKRRRQPYTAPADRKAASRTSRQRDRTERQRKMAAMRQGEEWALPAKDKGEVRRLARDVVDSRRNLSEYYLFSVFVLLIGIVISSVIAEALVILVILVVVTEGWYLGRKVQRLAQQRYPGQSTRGVRMYTAMRAMQLRRMRMPPPRFKPGDSV